MFYFRLALITLLVAIPQRSFSVSHKYSEKHHPSILKNGAFIINRHKNYYCKSSGVLISPRHVLTILHAIYEKPSREPSPTSQEKVQSRLGNLRIFFPGLGRDPKKEAYRAVSVSLLSPENQRLDDPIVLLTLDRKVKISDEPVKSSMLGCSGILDSKRYARYLQEKAPIDYVFTGFGRTDEKDELDAKGPKIASKCALLKAAFREAPLWVTGKSPPCPIAFHKENRFFPLLRCSTVTQTSIPAPKGCPPALPEHHENKELTLCYPKKSPTNLQGDSGAGLYARIRGKDLLLGIVSSGFHIPLPNKRFTKASPKRGLDLLSRRNAQPLRQAFESFGENARTPLEACANFFQKIKEISKTEPLIHSMLENWGKDAVKTIYRKFLNSYFSQVSPNSPQRMNGNRLVDDLIEKNSQEACTIFNRFYLEAADKLNKNNDKSGKGKTVQLIDMYPIYVLIRGLSFEQLDNYILFSPMDAKIIQETICQGGATRPHSKRL